MPIKCTCRHCGEINKFNFTGNCKYCYLELTEETLPRKNSDKITTENTEHELQGDKDFIIKRIIKTLENRKDFVRSDSAIITCDNFGNIRANMVGEKNGHVVGEIFEKDFKTYVRFETVINKKAQHSPSKALLPPILFAVLAIAYLIIKKVFFKLLTVDILFFLILAFVSAMKFLNFSSSTNKTLENLKIAKSEALRIVKSAERDYE